jgi:histidinol phosphatase-like PHP family hydrolase
MYDLHTHSLLSDGELLPSELARRYEAKGFKAIAITDHVDFSNIKIVVPALVEFCKNWPKNRIKVIPGIELTHIPLEHFKPLISYARKNGIKIIVAHGETTTEPVIAKTNKIAIGSGIDILAHPGRISREDVKFAKRKNVFLEITCRRGHRNTNTHVARLAMQLGAKLMINSDSHCPADIKGFSEFRRFGLKAGLNQTYLEKVLQDTSNFVGKII